MNASLGPQCTNRENHGLLGLDSRPFPLAHRSTAIISFKSDSDRVATRSDDLPSFVAKRTNIIVLNRSEHPKKFVTVREEGIFGQFFLFSLYSETEDVGVGT